MTGDERDLVVRATEGDSAAFEHLTERYWRMVSALAYQRTGNAEDTEDIVQEAFVKAYRALSSLKEPERFASWLYNITFKLCVDRHRKRSRRLAPVSLDQMLEQDREVASEQGEDPLEARDRSAIVLEAIAALPDLYRLVITLRFIEQLSHRQIAEHLGEPEGTISNRLHRASKMLRERLAPKLDLLPQPQPQPQPRDESAASHAKSGGREATTA